MFQAGETVCAESLMWEKHGLIKEPKEAECLEPGEGRK